MIVYVICYVLIGILFGITLHHYFSEDIPFDRIFGVIEEIMYRCANFLRKIKRNRFVLFVVRTINHCLLATLAVLKKAGSFIYKNRSVIEQAALNCASFVNENLTGEALEEYRTDYTLAFEHDDTVCLAAELEGHPYDIPTFENYKIENGIAWYDYRAFGFISRYEGLSLQALTQMSQRIINNYMWKTRRVKVAVFIKIATPTRLYFGIPLSRHGAKELYCYSAAF